MVRGVRSERPHRNQDPVWWFLSVEYLGNVLIPCELYAKSFVYTSGKDYEYVLEQDWFRSCLVVTCSDPIEEDTLAHRGSLPEGDEQFREGTQQFREENGRGRQPTEHSEHRLWVRERLCHDGGGGIVTGPQPSVSETHSGSTTTASTTERGAGLWLGFTIVWLSIHARSRPFRLFERLATRYGGVIAIDPARHPWTDGSFRPVGAKRRRLRLSIRVSSDETRMCLCPVARYRRFF